MNTWRRRILLGALLLLALSCNFLMGRLGPSPVAPHGGQPQRAFQM